MKPPSFLLLLVLCAAVAGCGEDDPPPGTSDRRLSHVEAPMDTARAEAGSAADTAAAPLPEPGDVADWWQAAPPNPRWPRPAGLAYTQYRNDAFDYVIAYPDTVLKPRADVGENRGREFASADGSVVALVYAQEDAGLHTLNEQYQDYLDDPSVRLTYRVREDDWYIVAGYRGRQKFYDKSMLRGSTLKTFQIQYDAAHAPYYDAVTATMATSFKG